MARAACASCRFRAHRQSELSGLQPAAHSEADRRLTAPGPALAISKGIDRDRAVDESGNQMTVFNRRGSRPFNKQEMERMYLHDPPLYSHQYATRPPALARKRPVAALSARRPWLGP